MLAPEFPLIIFTALILGNLFLTVFSVYDIATKPFKDKDAKVLWMIIVLALGIIGPLIYLTKRETLLAGPDEERDYLPPLDTYEKQLRHQQKDASAQSQNWYDDDQLV